MYKSNMKLGLDVHTVCVVVAYTHIAKLVEVLKYIYHYSYYCALRVTTFNTIFLFIINWRWLQISIKNKRFTHSLRKINESILKTSILS